MEDRDERRTYVVWPSQVRRFLSEQDRLLPEPPPLSPGCQEGGERKAPRIVSPAAGQIAMLLRGVPASEQEIPLEAEVAVLTTLSWFVDGKFVGPPPRYSTASALRISSHRPVRGRPIR